MSLEKNVCSLHYLLGLNLQHSSYLINISQSNEKYRAENIHDIGLIWESWIQRIRESLSKGHYKREDKHIIVRQEALNKCENLDSSENRHCGRFSLMQGQRRLIQFSESMVEEKQDLKVKRISDYSDFEIKLTLELKKK